MKCIKFFAHFSCLQGDLASNLNVFLLHSNVKLSDLNTINSDPGMKAVELQHGCEIADGEWGAKIQQLA
jgi:hypothetical protein